VPDGGFARLEALPLREKSAAAPLLVFKQLQNWFAARKAMFPTEYCLQILDGNKLW